MAARIVFVGTDTCHRLPVLVQAGYQVEHYESRASLGEAMQPDPDIDAILLTDLDPDFAERAVAIAQSCRACPVILFRDHNSDSRFGAFDVVIPPLTSPRKWLEQIGFLVGQRRARLRTAQRMGVQAETLSPAESGMDRDIV